MKHETFHYKQKSELEDTLRTLGVTLPLSDNIAVLKREVKIGSKVSANCHPAALPQQLSAQM